MQGKRKKKKCLWSVIQPPLGMSKNGGSSCDGCPYLVMSQTVSARERGITTLLASCLSTIFPFVSSRSDPTLDFRFYLPVSSRSDSKIHLCALSLFYSEFTSLSRLCLCFLLSTSSFLPSFPSSPRDRHQFSRVSRAMLATDGECLAKWDLSLV